MTAYMIFQVEWSTPAARQQYVERLPGLVEKYGGKWVVASSEPKTLEGQWLPGRTVIAEFPSSAAATQFYQSEEYRPLLETRLKGAKCNAILVEGSAPPASPPR